MTLRTELTPDILSRALPEDYECLPSPREGVLVHTLSDYPDGGVVDVYVLSRDDGLLVTDHGDLHGWLWIQTDDEDLTADQHSQIERVCQAQNVTLDRGRLLRRGVSEADILDAIERVAGAITQIAKTCAAQPQPHHS